MRGRNRANKGVGEEIVEISGARLIRRGNVDRRKTREERVMRLVTKKQRKIAGA